MRIKNPAALIMIKELKEGLRDPKTLFFTYMLPLVIYPLVFVWLIEFAAVRLNSLQSEVLTVVISAQVPDELKSTIQKVKNIRVREPLASSKPDLSGDASKPDAKARILHYLHAEKVAAIFDCESIRSPSLVEPNLRCSIYYDASNSRSLRVYSQLSRLTDSFRNQANAHRLKLLGITEDAIHPFTLYTNDVAGTLRVINKGASQVFPMLLIMILYVSSFYPALNSTIGERERGTFATLMTLPVTSNKLVLGKFLGVLTLCLAGLVSYLLPPLMGGHYLPSQAAAALKQGLTLPNSFGMLPILILPAAILLSAVSVCVGFFGRKMSEAQGYYSVLMLVLSFPLIISAESDLPLNAWTALIPLFNLVLALKSFLVDPLSYGLCIEAAIANVLGGGLFLMLAAYAIRAEYRADVVFSDLLSLKRNVVRNLTPSLAVLLFSVFLGSILYLDFALSNAPLLVTVSVTHLLVLIGFPVSVLSYYRLSLIQAFSIRRPTRQAILGAMLAGISCIFIISAFIPEFSFSKELSEEMMKRFLPKDQSVWLALLTVSFIPAIAEELAFRGVILNGLQRGFPKSWAILISSVMFAIAHLSLVRFLPTFCLGVVLGYVAIQSRSIFPGMIIHALNNGIIVLLAKHSHALGADDHAGEPFPRTLGLLALAVLSIALALIRQEKPSEGGVTVELPQVDKKVA